MPIQTHNGPQGLTHIQRVEKHPPMFPVAVPWILAHAIPRSTSRCRQSAIVRSEISEMGKNWRRVPEKGQM